MSDTNAPPWLTRGQDETPTADEALTAVCVWLRDRAYDLDNGDCYTVDGREILPDGREGVLLRALADELATGAETIRRIVGKLRDGTLPRPGGA